MYIFAVKSVLDGVSKYFVQSSHSANIGDIVSFDTNDGEQFAIVEMSIYSYDGDLIKMLDYAKEQAYSINCLFSLEYRRQPDAGAS